ncbi:helix-turn-helix domain-containing protein [Rufibacter quisquiliarum]|uniref:Transcriptional regulator with XRE-family HTH domain n=1 Tax=Rufibacter quisquiliarum TaxID=1549639 RepID=A0A839GN78_9BACT|nr:helix-turn-helix transcriptional regulator [Rufibacter quisquiliarum]MBA9078269.1 transcriptional regulator with XRE-family HTH domain [Rufibacter quisquiliarum]
MTLAQKIVGERKRKGLSQEELADLSQISLRTIQRIEREESLPRGYTLKALAQALAIPLEELTPSTAPDVAQAEPPAAVVPVPPPTAPEAVPAANLQQINLAAFAFLLLPYLGFLLPLWLWKQQKGLPGHAAGARIINFQIMWCIGMHLALLLAFLVQMVSAYYFKARPSFLLVGTFFFLYFLNIAAILRAAIQLRSGHRQVFAKWGNLFIS